MNRAWMLAASLAYALGVPHLAHAQWRPTQPAPRIATGVEMASLYATSAAWGVGTGVWLNEELSVTDPGLWLLAPGLLGVGAPLGVFLWDDFDRRPEGEPSSIAAGLYVGAATGMGLASLQWVTADEEDAWGFRGLSRAMVIGSTAGGALGYAAHRFLSTGPRDAALVASGTTWGALLGSAIGGGISSGTWGEANDTVARAGLIGMGVGLGGSLALTQLWTPSMDQIAWMWAGFGLGAVVTSPVFLFYLGGESDARRGFIVQGAGATVGLVLGALIFGRPEAASASPSPGQGYGSSWVVSPMSVGTGQGLGAVGVW